MPETTDDSMGGPHMWLRALLKAVGVPGLPGSEEQENPPPRLGSTNASAMGPGTSGKNWGYRPPVQPPVPQAPAAPMPIGGPIQGARPLQRMPVPMGQPMSLGGPQGSPFPSVPPLPTPPQVPQAGGAGIDYSQANRLMEEGRPVPPNKEAMNQLGISAVLGGLAKGAGEVHADEPGSFARALAMAGAGGQEGRRASLESGLNRQERFQEEKQKFAQAGAQQAIEQERIQAESAHADALLRFHASEMVWKTQVEDRNLQLEQQYKEFGLGKPEIKSESAGWTMSTYDKDSGKWNVQFFPKSILDRAESTGEQAKIMGGSDAMAEQATVTNLATAVANGTMHPQVADYAIKEKIIRDLVVNNQAAAIFGDAYLEEAKKASDRITKVSGAALQGLKPEVFDQQVKREVAAALMNRVMKDGGTQWLEDAARQGSLAAGVLLHQMQTRPQSSAAPPAPSAMSKQWPPPDEADKIAAALGPPKFAPWTEQAMKNVDKQGNYRGPPPPLDYYGTTVNR